MNGKFSKVFVFVFLGCLFLVNSASAAGFDIWAGTGNGSQTCNVLPTGCSFCDAMKVAINLVNILTTAAVSITVAMIVYGAIRLMISGGSESMLGEAKKIITSAIIGFVIVLCGWLVINTVIHIIAGQVNFPWSNVQC
ncbi:MAG: hypothetical protein ABSE68_00770 [Minisyncoccia bacterium]